MFLTTNIEKANNAITLKEIKALTTTSMSVNDIRATRNRAHDVMARLNDDLMTSPSNINIKDLASTSKDVHKCLGKNWFSDYIINATLAYTVLKPQSSILSTFHYDTFIKKLRPLKDTALADNIYIPVNINNSHWILPWSISPV